MLSVKAGLKMTDTRPSSRPTTLQSLAFLLALTIPFLVVAVPLILLAHEWFGNDGIWATPFVVAVQLLVGFLLYRRWRRTQ